MNKALPCYTESETNFYVSKAINYLLNYPSLIGKHQSGIQNLLYQFQPDIKRKYLQQLRSYTDVEFH